MKTQQGGDPLRKAARASVKKARVDLQKAKTSAGASKYRMVKKYGHDTSMYPAIDKSFAKGEQAVAKKKEALKVAKQQKKNLRKS